MKRLPPSAIETMMHYYYSPEPHPNVRSSAVQSALHEFVECALLEADEMSPSGFRVTEKGTAWVEMICRTPFPYAKAAWHDPRNNEQIR